MSSLLVSLEETEKQKSQEIRIGGNVNKSLNSSTSQEHLKVKKDFNNKEEKANKVNYSSSSSSASFNTTHNREKTQRGPLLGFLANRSLGKQAKAKSGLLRYGEITVDV